MQGKESMVIYNADNLLRKQNIILTTLIRISMLQESIGIASKKIVDILKKEYPIDYCTLALKENNKLKATYADVDKYTEKELLLLIEDKLTEIVDIKVITSKDDYYLSYKSAEERGIKYCLLLSLKTNKEILGALLIEKKNLEGTEILEQEAFKAIIETVTMAIENVLLHEKVKKLATIDQLTQTYNRRYLYDEYILESLDPVYSVAMIDIDFFKKVNDTYGHAAGDEVLKAVAKTLYYTADTKGTVFRYGGEEFLICFNATLKVASEILEEMRRAIEIMTVTSQGKRIKVTISGGVATNREIEGFEEIRNLADARLYFSKENGRNQITNKGKGE